MFFRLVLCVLPLVFTPFWGFLIAEGYLNLGGGEKDLLILIPWLLWSLIYLVLFIVAWKKRLSILRGLMYAAGGATALLGIVWGIMFVWFSGILGVS